MKERIAADPVEEDLGRGVVEPSGEELAVVGEDLIGGTPLTRSTWVNASQTSWVRSCFHGHVSEAEKHQLLARAWVHALPSLKEGWGLVVVEAGVHGTPTVAFSEAGGPTNSILHGRTGLLVDHGLDDFTRALRSVLTDAELRGRMSDEVTTWVSKFHWDETVDRWEATLLAASGRGQG